MSARKSSATVRTGRYLLLLGMLALSLLAVAARLVYLQVFAAPAYAQRAEDQRLRDIVLSPQRGTIFDREGEPLALSMEARTIYATPPTVVDAEETAKALAKVLGGEPKDYVAKLTKDAQFVYVARKVDMDRVAAIEALDLAGIGFLEDWRRVYPSGELACQVLGFVGVDDEGLAGLEKHYDHLLAGTPGSILAERDPQGRLLPGGVMQRREPVDGSDIVLTLDKDIQYEAQTELAAAVKKWKAKAGSIVVMDPRTGEILAMATVPGFNPNSYADAKESRYRNRPITDMYEPGSTAKTFTAAAVLDQGLFGPDSMFKLPSKIEVGGRTIGEAHGRPTVNWSLAEIVTQSSNVGSVKLGLALGEQRLYEYLERFGLTEKTGVDFPGESPGTVPPVENWSASSIGTIPFGQGIAVTPLQLARALSAIANAGEMPAPHFMKSVPDGAAEIFKRPLERAVSADTAAATTEILTGAVTGGTGESAAVPGYTVAGKTGTAQKARTDGRGYATGSYVASFSGFLPAEDPQVLIVVCIDEPRDAIYGGVVAAPVFQKVAAFSVSHLKVPPASANSIDVTATPETDR